MRCIILILLLGIHLTGTGQSVARKWNEALMGAIRTDKARPTVQARNLYHISAAMFDAWATFDDVASTSMISKPKSPNRLISRPRVIKRSATQHSGYPYSGLQIPPGEIIHYITR